LVVIADISKAASDVILLFLKQRSVDMSVKGYALVKEYNLHGKLRDDTKRSLLNALCNMKRYEYAREVFELLKDTILFPEQRLDVPRYITLHRSNTLFEIVIIIKEYLVCLYNKFVELLQETQRITSHDLQLGIAFSQLSRFTANQQEVQLCDIVKIYDLVLHDHFSTCVLLPLLSYTLFSPSHIPFIFSLKCD